MATESYSEIAKRSLGDSLESFTIDSKLPEDMIDECKLRAKMKVEERGQPILKVENKPSGQTFVVLCIVGSQCRQKNEVSCVQVLGCFPTAESGSRFAAEVSKTSPDFDIYVAEMYKWLPLNTKPEDAQNVVWRNKKVDELMHDYAEQRALNQELFEARKSACTEAHKVRNIKTIDQSGVTVE